MNKVTVDVKDNTYIITGDIEDAIIKRRRARSNFESIGANFETSGQITIPLSTKENDQDQQYALIQKLLNRFNITEEKTKQAEGLLADYDREKQNFADFSIKAKNIRNNQHEGNEFEDFSKVLKSKLIRDLYTLQLLSAYHLTFAQNACNFSVPGAGKTSIVYGAYAYLNSLPPDNSKYVDRLLIVGPISSFAPWQDEYKECFGRTTTIRRLVGVDAHNRRLHFYSRERVELTLISYQGLAASQKDIIDFLRREKVMVVLDEAHRIKNVDGGQWSAAALSIAQYASSRVILTGTPAPNGYQDLFNLYRFIWPQKKIIKFPANYLIDLSTNKTAHAKEKVNELVEDISPFFIRIKKTDLGLPDAIENNPCIIEMGGNQQTIYDYIERKYVDYFEQERNIGSFTGKLKTAKLIRLIQCATNPNLLNKPLDNYLREMGISDNTGIDDRDIVQLIKSYSSTEEIPTKFVETGRLIKKTIEQSGPAGKVIVWTIHISNMLDLQDYLYSQDIQSERLCGDVPNEEDDIDENIITREKIISNFHRKDCPYKVIIANPFAVGESISLHKACHNAIYLEMNFNAAMYMQSKDRIHRVGLGKDDKINYYYFLSKDSVDEVVHKRVLEKEKRMLDIIESEEIPLLSMNADDANGDDNDIQAIIKFYHDRQNS